MYTIINGVKTPVNIQPTDEKKNDCFILYCLSFVILVMIGFLIWKMFAKKQQQQVGYRLY